MNFTLFKVFFITMHLFTTFAAATIDDIGNRDIANIAIPIVVRTPLCLLMTQSIPTMDLDVLQ